MSSPSNALRALRSFESSLHTTYRRAVPLLQLQSLQRPFSSKPHQAAGKTFIDPILSLENSIASQFKQPSGTSSLSSLIPERNPLEQLENLQRPEFYEEARHHMHIYSTKHNTHITLTKPNRDALISLSCGNIGFRKAGRGSYDAAYQLAAFVMSRIQDKGLLTQIQRLELVYRGFGPGREAVTKAILGSEGRNIRGKIVRLTDSTRLKFGGIRSPAPRRLG